MKEGESFTVEVKAEGTGLKYQWQYYATEEGEWKNCGNGTEAKLTKKMLASWNGLQVKCIVEDAKGNREETKVIVYHVELKEAAWKLENGVLTIYGEFNTKELTTVGDSPTAVIVKNAKKIPDKAFYNWSNLKKVHIDKGVEEIGNSAFSGCNNLETLILSPGLKIIGADAFYENYKLTNLDIPNGVSEIGEYAFGNCYHLKKVRIPATVTEMRYAFAGQTEIETIGPEGGDCDLEYSWKNDMTDSKIPNKAFARMKNLNSAVIEGVETLGAYTFANCIRLNRVLIGNKVKYIETGVFYGDSLLESVSITDQVVDIGPYEVFDGCSSKMVIYCPKNSYIMNWAEQNGIRYMCI